MEAAIRISTNVRKPLGEEIKRIAEQEGRKIGDLTEQLLDEAVKARAVKGLARDRLMTRRVLIALEGIQSGPTKVTRLEWIELPDAECVYAERLARAIEVVAPGWKLARVAPVDARAWSF